MNAWGFAARERSSQAAWETYCGDSTTVHQAIRQAFRAGFHRGVIEGSTSPAGPWVVVSDDETKEGKQ